MQYQLIQDTLTYLINGVAISGVLAAGTTIVYQYWTQERLKPQLVEGEPCQDSSQPKSIKSLISVQQPVLNREEQQIKIELSQLQQQLSFTQEQLQEAQHQLAQSHQHKLQIQSYYDAKLQQAQQQEQQAQFELSQLRQQLSSTEEELQKTQQELIDTKEGVQGFVNQMFVSDKKAKEWFKKLFSNNEVSQQPTSN
ncbi:hypothetical protein Glo7428_2772 [Gloeocapsa sp. PCC 7428]|uniref:hypothetical protein n=1 Tax=Gloeocapsa sp. PCC 7428 TaxID=1173026 RepID=UPI0002A5F545|nr:hypothetical protein [Gloeocapsa sp. PCC 7428]AFZ31273.1 hypothetical protein Glo7428_2772 [Gloeocapsa sp. PCC 7428]